MLDEYLANHPVRKNACAVCDLPGPVLDELREARRRRPPVPYPLLAGYVMDEHGFPVRDYQVRDHFLRHERGTDGR
jgi:hypothetical protein